MFSDQYLLELRNAHNGFFNGTGHPEKIVRKEVYDSWLRSKSHHVSPENARKHKLSDTELDQYISQNQILYDIASSFLDTLYQFVKGSGFICLFAEKNGYILNAVGDEDIMRMAGFQQIPLVIGSCRSEAIMGTNAIGTPLCTGEPIQLSAYEHYVELSSNWTCSGAPIILNNEILGVICISGSFNQVHTHTLGMAISAAEAISQQLHMTQTKNQLKVAIDSIHSGVLLLDNNYNISLINAIAESTLGYTQEEILSSSYKKIFPQLSLDQMKENVYDFETTAYGKKDSIQCFVTIKFVQSTTSNIKNSFLISFRQTEHVRNLVNKYIGSDAHFTFDHIIGECPAIERIKILAKKVSMSNANVLITGESGTGKELFAQSIHNNSHFSKGPFIAINCGAIPKDLIESELFGYESGSFTGAKRDGCAGKFELANNGTIFLDEIGDMPYDVQVRLLRVLQEKSVTRIGGKKSIPLNVRIIAATNRDLEKAIENQTFRSDLYYRLNVFSIHIPPLRERGNDVFLLVRHFLSKYQQPEYDPICQIDDNVKSIFQQYQWPGNIRELENVIERACILTANGTLTLEALPSNMVNMFNMTSNHNQAIKSEPSVAMSQILTADETEKQLILEHLHLSSGNVKKAAESLGISRRTLYRKLEKYDINSNELRYPGSQS